MWISEPLKIDENLYCTLHDARQVNTAVVFVHGFGGHALRTWLQFPTLTSQLSHLFPWWRECDSYFWGYASRGERILMASQDFQLLLEKIYPNPNKLLFPNSQRMPDRRYSQLLIVGHSQGALVIRHAVLNAVEQERSMSATVGSGQPGTNRQPEWLNKAQVRLFAPALMGASEAGLLGFLLKFPLTSAVLQSYLAACSGYQDLQPTNPLLGQIRTGTIEALETGRQVSALRARILYGRSETVVHAGAYPADIVDTAEPNKNHQNVCKPTLMYTRPLSFVRYDENDS